jgi:hypothetical protein
LKTETLEIKVTADLSDFPVILKTAEYEAYREAVEVLEAMESEARIDALVAGNVRDYYLKNWEAQRDECRRLSAQVARQASEIRAHKDLVRIAEDEAERMRGIEADAVGSEIVALVRDGYGVRIEPGNFARMTPATITVEKRVGEMRHANRGALDIREVVNSITVVSNLAYTLRKVAYQLKRAIQPQYATGGIVGPGEWLGARTVTPKPGFSNKF